MRSSAVSIGDNAEAAQYNALRQDAFGAAFLLAHEQNTPDLTLKVEAGVCYVGATRVIFAGGNSPSFTAPAANPRIDLLTIDSAGTLARTAGTEAASPSVPAYPSDKLVIAEVYNRVGQTTVRDSDQGSNGYIKQDVRPFLGGAYIANAAQIADGVITDAKLASTDFVKQNCAQIYAADAQANDTYVITLSPAPGSYTNGMLVIFKANTANTGACTLNVNSLGAKTIKKQKDLDLADNDIKAGSLVAVVYDGTNFQMLNPVANTSASVIGVLTTDFTHQNNTNEQTMVSWTIPGGTLGTNAGIRAKLFVQNFNNNGNGSNTVRVKYGATTLTTVVYPTDAGGQPNGYFDITIIAAGATNAQEAYVEGSFETDHLTMSATQGKYTYSYSYGTAAEDSTADKTLAITIQASGVVNSPSVLKGAYVSKL